ncbi:hypothetical protein [Caldisphaera sp.]|nr:hypothetical protein [Caldisphaera sp.]
MLMDIYGSSYTGSEEFKRIANYVRDELVEDLRYQIMKWLYRNN